MCAFVAGTGCSAENLTSQSPPVLSAPNCFKKENRGVHKESVVNNLGNPTSKIVYSLNNEPNSLLPRITAFSARGLPSKKGMEGGRIVFILGNDIMDSLLLDSRVF